MDAYHGIRNRHGDLRRTRRRSRDSSLMHDPRERPCRSRTHYSLPVLCAIVSKVFVNNPNRNHRGCKKEGGAMHIGYIPHRVLSIEDRAEMERAKEAADPAEVARFQAALTTPGAYAEIHPQQTCLHPDVCVCRACRPVDE